MMGIGTKADHIRHLYALDTLSVQQIALRVGCSDAYVRVCARQRLGGKLSKADKTYLAKPGTLEAMRIYRKIRFATGDSNKAKAAWRDTYYQWRYDIGVSTRKAHLKACKAYAATRYNTTSVAGRRQAIKAAQRARQQLRAQAGKHGNDQDIQGV